MYAYNLKNGPILEISIQIDLRNQIILHLRQNQLPQLKQLLLYLLTLQVEHIREVVDVPQVLTNEAYREDRVITEEDAVTFMAICCYFACKIYKMFHLLLLPVLPICVQEDIKEHLCICAMF